MTANKRVSFIFAQWTLPVDYLAPPQSAPHKISVILVATETFYDHNRDCSLRRLCSVLNSSQNVFFFVSASPDHRPKKNLNWLYLRLHHNIALKNREYIKTRGRGVVDAAINSYFVDQDAFDQLEAFVAQSTGRAPVLSSYIIGIGAEVVVPDVDDNEFDGISALDAYSCLGNTLGLDDEDNNKPKKFNNVCYISLLRCDLLFPETGIKRADRGIIARYIIANICVVLADKTFGRALSHEHMAKCVLSTYWSGVESERNGYDDESICLECQESATSSGVASKFTALKLSSEDVIVAINTMLKRADAIVGTSQKSYRFLVELLLVVFGTGLTTNLISGYDDTTSAYIYYQQHKYQVFASIALYTCGSILALRAWLKGNSLP